MTFTSTVVADTITSLAALFGLLIVISVVRRNGDDPLSKALHGLINHAARQDEQMERMMATMRAAGLACPDMPQGDRLDSVQLNRLVD